MPETRPGIEPGRTILVAGSLAFDHIMDFPGYFKDHILPEKIHVLNISFLVEKLTKQRGGCAGNIAYSLSLLGERPRILAAVGPDFEDYGAWLRQQGIATDTIAVFDDETTASCFITTDKADNQLTGFYVGAMRRARELSLQATLSEDVAACIIAPDDPEALIRHCQEARQAGARFVFDPSFQVSALDGAALREAARGAWALLVNDYELAVFQDKTGAKREEILEWVELLVVTLGPEGSEIFPRGGSPVRIPAAGPREVVDPTGAGDAYRAGFVSGLLSGHDLAVCGRMGSVAAVWAVEHYGTQNHRYTLTEFWARYQENFGTVPAAAPTAQ